MALETNQQALELGKLYKVDALSESDIQRDLSASVWIDSGSVDIYGSDSDTVPVDIASMTLNSGDTAVSGKKAFETLTNYIAITQNSGTTTEIVISGVHATEIGDIS